jgi:hypothetical protein
MRLYVVLATSNTLSMVAAVVAAGWRWPRLPRGIRLIVSGTAIFASYSLIAAPLSRAGVRTRLLQEGPILLGALMYLIGFAALQPQPRQRRLLGATAFVFVVLWGLAQWAQGVRADFSEISGPIHASILAAASGYTLVNLVRVTQDQWTSQVWYWVCIGLMLVYGTEVLLDPLMANVFGVRNDLILFPYYFHQVASSVGYLLMAVGLSRARVPSRRSDRLAAPRQSGRNYPALGQVP